MSDYHWESLTSWQASILLHSLSCNITPLSSYSGKNTVNYPGFGLNKIRITRKPVLNFLEGGGGGGGGGGVGGGGGGGGGWGGGGGGGRW